MSVSDPALTYIESRKDSLMDFVFRLTGDRSRAGIVANEVCAYVHRELMSSWSQHEIRVELFAYAYEINSDAARGIEKSFLEQYYRHQYEETKKVALYYPLELFLVDLGPELALVATLAHRFHFADEDIARIMDKSLEEVEAARQKVRSSLKKHPKIKIEEALHLPVYDFLVLPEHHPTDISHILGDMKFTPIQWSPKTILLLILLGLIIGFIIYQILRFFSP